MKTYEIYLLVQGVSYFLLGLIFFRNYSKFSFDQKKAFPYITILFITLFLVRLVLLVTFNTKGESWRNQTYDMGAWDGVLTYFVLAWLIFQVTKMCSPGISVNSVRIVLFMLIVFLPLLLEFIRISSSIRLPQPESSFSADLAKLAYSITNNTKTLERDLTILNALYLKKDITIVTQRYSKATRNRYAILKSKDKDYYLIFAGVAEDQQILPALEFIPCKYPNEWIKSAGNKYLKNRDIKVHKGFLETYKEFRGEIMGRIGEIYNSDMNSLMISGHSVGGSLAVLSGFDLATNNLSKKTNIFSYGSPAVGDGVFVDFYDLSYKNRSYRVVNPLDPAPKVFEMHLRHVNEYYPVTVQLTTPGPDTIEIDVTNHSVNTYVKAMNQVQPNPYVILISNFGKSLVLFGLSLLIGYVVRNSAEKLKKNSIQSNANSFQYKLTRTIQKIQKVLKIGFILDCEV